jgi:hypothetical protein
MQQHSVTSSETAPAEAAPTPLPAAPPRAAAGPAPWVRATVAVLLRLGLGVSLLNGGLMGYQVAQNGTGGSGSTLAWSTLLGPGAVASALEHDLLVPVVQIAIGLALILGFFTVLTTIAAGLLVLSAPIFQFLAILSSSSAPSTAEQVAMQALATTGSINLLLLVAAVLWLTPPDGTPWSLDYLIFAHRRAAARPPTAAPGGGAPPAGASATRAE